MKPAKPTYQIILASMPSDVDPDSRIAQFLKSAKRRFKFRCVSVVKVESEVLAPRPRRRRKQMSSDVVDRLERQPQEAR